jgi:ABC-type branched-subunit amino acid transport system ATPase component
LRIDGVSKAFGGIQALDNVALEVRPGEIVGLIGPNGAGKTTLMNVISGAVRVDTGSIRIGDREVARLSPEGRASCGLGRSFQDAALFRGLTVRETVQIALARQHRVGMVAAGLATPWAHYTERKTQNRADEVMARLGLSPWADSLVSELSTGTRRICDLAAQMAAEPSVLLLDEPTAGVAQRESEAFGPLLRRVRDELDCSILVVEHDLPLLSALCDRIYAMETGRVIAEGTPKQVQNDPRVIASYLGTDDGTVARSGRQRARVATRR